MVLAVNILSSLLLLLSASSIFYALSAESWVIYTGAIVIAHISLRRPFYEAAVNLLIFAYIADLLASGPPGIHGLVLTLTFFAVQALAQKVGGRMLLATFALTFLGSLLIALAEALLLTLFLPEHSALATFAKMSWLSATLSAAIALPYSLLLSQIEKLWRQRTQRTVAVD